MSSDSVQKAPRRASILFRLRRSVSTPVLRTEAELAPVPAMRMLEDGLWEKEIPCVFPTPPVTRLPVLKPREPEHAHVVIPKVCLFPPDHDGQPFILFIPRPTPLLQVGPVPTPRPRPVSIARQSPFELPTPVFVRTRGILMPIRKDAYFGTGTGAGAGAGELGVGYGHGHGHARSYPQPQPRRVCTDPLPVRIEAVAPLLRAEVEAVELAVSVTPRSGPSSTAPVSQVKRKHVRKKMSFKRLFFPDPSPPSTTHEVQNQDVAVQDPSPSKPSLRINTDQSTASVSSSTSGSSSLPEAEQEIKPLPRTVSKRLSLSNLSGAFKRRSSKLFIPHEPVPSVPPRHPETDPVLPASIPALALALAQVESPVSMPDALDSASDCSSICSTDDVNVADLETAPRIKVIAHRAVFHMHPSPTLESISSASDADESDESEVCLATPAIEAGEWSRSGEAVGDGQVKPVSVMLEYEESWEEALGLPIS